MKNLLFTICVMAISLCCFAQSLTKPDYVGQIGLINPDSTITLLPKEQSSMGGKANALSHIPVPGISLFGKSKATISLNGKNSGTVMESRSFSLILRGPDNKTAPEEIISVFTFDVKKKKREHEIASFSAIGGYESNIRQNSIPWEAHKYGEDCYIITFKDLEPGEYGITLAGDIINVCTFSIK